MDKYYRSQKICVSGPMCNCLFYVVLLTTTSHNSGHFCFWPLWTSVQNSESMRFRTHVYWTFFSCFRGYYHLSKYSTLFNTLYMSFRTRQNRRSLAPAWNDLWWKWWPMISGDWWGLRFPDIFLQLRKKPGKTSIRKTDPTGDRTRARWVRGNDVTPRSQRWSRSGQDFILYPGTGCVSFPLSCVVTDAGPGILLTKNSGRPALFIYLLFWSTVCGSPFSHLTHGFP